MSHTEDLLVMYAELVEQIAQQGWTVQPDFITEQAAAALRQDCFTAWQDGLFHLAGTGRAQGHAVRPTVRNDAVLWLDQCPNSPALAGYYAAIEQLRLHCNRELAMGLFELEAHFAMYSEGSSYQRHMDRFRDDDRRALSTVLYLNEAWHPEQGGQLRLYIDDRTHFDVWPQSGTLAVFLSERFEHEVLPARRQRLSITGWLKRRGY